MHGESGLRKTIPSYADGWLKESMSFENINYEEICHNDDWFESTTLDKVKRIGVLLMNMEEAKQN